MATSIIIQKVKQVLKSCAKNSNIVDVKSNYDVTIESLIARETNLTFGEVKDTLQHLQKHNEIFIIDLAEKNVTIYHKQVKLLSRFYFNNNQEYAKYIRQRTWDFLCSIVRHRGRNQFDMSQAFVANSIGATNQEVHRALKVLQNRGLLTFKGQPQKGLGQHNTTHFTIFNEK